MVVTVPSLQSVDPSPIDKPASGPNAVARGSLAYEHRNVPLAPQGLQLGVAEESDLVRAGDIILGACKGRSAAWVWVGGSASVLRNLRRPQPRTRTSPSAAQA